MSDNIISFDEELLEETIEQTEKPVVLKFWAEWCGPCKVFAGVYEQVSSERDDLTFGEVDIDSQYAIADEYGVKGVPSVVVLDQDGEELLRTTGNKQKGEFNDFLDEAVTQT